MDEAMRKRLEDLWRRNAAASASLQRIVDAQADLARKQLYGVTNEARAAALWAAYEEALKRALEIGDELHQAARDAGILPKSE
jgi:predicted  nucleic acid-binding Zn-ribbon protein